MKKLICALIIIVAMVTTLCSCTMLNDFMPKTPPAEEEQSTITLNCYEKTLNAAESFQIEADTNGGETLKWKSSNENVALVNSQGTVTAVSGGVANITCYNSTSEAVCTVTVNEQQEVATTPQDSATNTSANFIFPHSSTAYLTEAEVSAKLSSLTGYSPAGKYAQDAINEIYARNGYVFKQAKTSSYYNSQPWYQPNSAFTTADFNNYEKQNIALLKKFL